MITQDRIDRWETIYSQVQTGHGSQAVRDLWDLVIDAFLKEPDDEKEHALALMHDPTIRTFFENARTSNRASNRVSNPQKNLDRSPAPGHDEDRPLPGLGVSRVKM